MSAPPAAISPKEPSMPHQGQAVVFPSEHIILPHSQTTTPNCAPQQGQVGTPRKAVVLILWLEFPSDKLLYISSL